MALSLGSFTKNSDGSFNGTLRTINITAAISIIPAAKSSEAAPDYRVYAGNGRMEIGAAWSQVAKSSGETYLNVKVASPEFGDRNIRARLVKLEEPTDDGSEFLLLWEPRDR